MIGLLSLQLTNPESTERDARLHALTVLLTVSYITIEWVSVFLSTTVRQEIR